MSAVPVAYLRVYEPLAAFSPNERAHWERYLAAEEAPDLLAGARLEGSEALVRAVRSTLDVAVERAYVAHVDGLPLVCPWDSQLRVWEEVGQFLDGLADLVADMFVPRAQAEQAESRLAAARAAQQQLRRHVQESPWVLPLPWFLPFEGSERQHVEASGNRPPQLRYVTAMSQARRRMAMALDVLTRTIPQAPVVVGVEGIARWLEEFHPYSRVELDYGGVAGLFAAADLTADTTAADLSAGVAALRSGDGAAATAAYERVVARWRPLELRARAS